MKCWVSLELWRFRAEWNLGRFLAVREFDWTSAQPTGWHIQRLVGSAHPTGRGLVQKGEVGDLMIGDSANLVPRDPIF